MTVTLRHLRERYKASVILFIINILNNFLKVINDVLSGERQHPVVDNDEILEGRGVDALPIRREQCMLEAPNLRHRGRCPFHDGVGGSCVVTAINA